MKFQSRISRSKRHGVHRSKIARYRRNPTFGSKTDYPRVDLELDTLGAVYSFLLEDARLLIAERFIKTYGPDYLDVSEEQFDRWRRVAMQRAPFAREFKVRPKRGKSYVVTSIAEKIAIQYLEQAEAELLASYRRKYGRSKGQMQEIRREFGPRIAKIACLIRSDKYNSPRCLYELMAEILGVSAQRFDPVSGAAKYSLHDHKAILRALAPVVDSVFVWKWQDVVSELYGGSHYWLRVQTLSSFIATPVFVWIIAGFSREAARYVEREKIQAISPAEYDYYDRVQAWAISGSPLNPPAAPTSEVPYMSGAVERSVALFAALSIPENNESTIRQFLREILVAVPSDVPLDRLSNEWKASEILVQWFPQLSIIEL